MAKFEVPTRETVSEVNQGIFDNLEKSLGFVPNIFATYAYSEHGMGRYMAFSSGKSSLTNREKEVVNLAVSQINGCVYCLAAHTAIGKMNGFTEAQIIELRKGKAGFDPKLNALAQLVKEITENRGKVTEETLDAFFGAGYGKGHLVDVVLGIAEKTSTNLLHNITQVPVDFPEAPKI